MTENDDRDSSSQEEGGNIEAESDDPASTVVASESWGGLVDGQLHDPSIRSIQSQSQWQTSNLDFDNTTRSCQISTFPARALVELDSGFGRDGWRKKTDAGVRPSGEASGFSGIFTVSTEAFNPAASR